MRPAREALFAAWEHAAQKGQRPMSRVIDARLASPTAPVGQASAHAAQPVTQRAGSSTGRPRKRSGTRAAPRDRRRSAFRARGAASGSRSQVVPRVREVEALVAEVADLLASAWASPIQSWNEGSFTFQRAMLPSSPVTATCAISPRQPSTIETARRPGGSGGTFARSWLSGRFRRWPTTRWAVRSHSRWRTQARGEDAPRVGGHDGDVREAVEAEGMSAPHVARGAAGDSADPRPPATWPISCTKGEVRLPAARSDESSPSVRRTRLLRGRRRLGARFALPERASPDPSPPGKEDLATQTQQGGSSARPSQKVTEYPVGP
jgi:hypothetical protein